MVGVVALERGPLRQRGEITHAHLLHGEGGDVRQHAPGHTEDPRGVTSGRDGHETHAEHGGLAPMGVAIEQTEDPVIGHEHVVHLVVERSGASQPLHVPAVGEHDLLARKHRGEQSDVPVLVELELPVAERQESGAHEL